MPQRLMAVSLVTANSQEGGSRRPGSYEGTTHDLISHSQKGVGRLGKAFNMVTGKVGLRERNPD